MKLTFEEATLSARALEEFNAVKKNMFDRTTRLLRGDTNNGFNKASPEKLRDRLREYQKDIESSQALISKMRTEIVRLSEMTQVHAIPELQHGDHADQR